MQLQCALRVHGPRQNRRHHGANGDQITGAVNEMTAGKLSLGTSYAGTVKIKWREVRQIDSRYVYEVRLDDGERIYGCFAANDIPNQLTFRSGSKDRQLEIDDIVRSAPSRKSSPTSWTSS